MLPSTLAKCKVFAARSIYLIIGFAEQRSFGELVQEYVRIFHTSVTLAGWSLTIIAGLSHISAPIIRILIDLTSLRLVAIVGGLVYGASYIILGLFADNIWQLFAFHTLIGFSSAAANLASLLAIGEHYETSFGIANSTTYLIAAVISIVFPYLILYLNIEYGLRRTLLLYGAISWNLIASGIWVTSKKVQPTPDNESDGFLLTNQRSQASLLRAHPISILLSLLFGVTFYLSVGVALILYLFGIEKGLDIDTAALLISWYGAGSVCSRVYVFFLFKWNLHYCKIVVLTPIVIEIVMQLFATLTTNAYFISSLALFSGFSIGSMNTWSSSMVKDLSCEVHFKSAASWLTTFGGVGATFAGLFAGWIHGIAHSYQHVMISYVALNVIQLMLVLVILILKPVANCVPCK